MGVKAMGWAYDQRVGDPVRKAVLVALGNIADEDGYCWPGMRRIAWMAEVSPRTAQRAVQDLEAAGFLHVERERTRDNGAKTSNAYRLPIEARHLQFDVAADAYDKLTHPPRVTGAEVSRGQGGGDSGVTTTELPLEPSFELSVKDSGRPPGAPEWLPLDAWNDFVAMRIKKRLPITPKARELLFKKLDTFRAQDHDPAAVLYQSVENGWTGVFGLKPERRGGDRAERDRAKADEAVRMIEGGGGS